MSTTAMQQPRQYPISRLMARIIAGTAFLAFAAAPAGAQQLALASLAVAAAPHAAPHDVVGELRSRNLLIPVEGIVAGQLHDTFNDARSEGRVHDAIDIHAPLGTPVLATTDGTIIKLHQGARGGNSIYQLDPDGRTRYYYAHLSRYADGLHEGTTVHRGDVIGYVGDTGNAAPGDYHLHFSIAILSDRSRWWEGENVNPYEVWHGR